MFTAFMIPNAKLPFEPLLPHATSVRPITTGHHDWTKESVKTLGGLRPPHSIFEEFRITIAKQTLSRELRALGYRKLAARPRHHAQVEGVVEDFKKLLRAPGCHRAREGDRQRQHRSLVCRRSRIGQKNKITRRWAKRGTRPSAPRDQRTASTYIFGAVGPKEGKGAVLILPTCNTEAMNLHLAEIAEIVAPGAHAVLMVDQAGWHLSTHLVVPPNIIIALPPKSPKLNPVENVWQFMRDNWLSNRVFKSYDGLANHCCQAWNKLVDQPWLIIHRIAPMGTGSDQWEIGITSIE